MENVWMVRSEFGTYTQAFLTGGYAAIGWLPEHDLSAVTARDELDTLYRHVYREDAESNNVVGQQVGQIHRFIFQIEVGDYVTTAPSETEWLHYGKVTNTPYYYFPDNSDGCPFPHRRKVVWADERLRRSEFSIPMQNTLRSSLTVFGISQTEEFLRRIHVLTPTRPSPSDPYEVVLDKLLHLTPQEFEILVGHLLAAVGFEETRVTGRPGDGGVDVEGVLNASNLGKVKVLVQVKRYQPNNRVSASVVKQLRQAIPFGGQGAFVTTSGFRSGAADVAEEQGFPRIGLINGHQLVGLLVQYWDSIPQEFQDTLGLQRGLVRR